MKFIATAAICLAALTNAHAADPDVARNLAATCANCHGTDGRAVPGAGMVPLAGESRDSLLKKMAEFKAGSRPATIMHQIAKGYTDEQLALIAGYFAGRK